MSRLTLNRRTFVPPSRLARPVEKLLSRVLKNEKQARHEMETEAVHDLRTALRRTRSLAEDFADFDKHKDWHTLRKTAKSQQRSLGDLRDAQVLEEFVKQLRLNSGREGKELIAKLEREQSQGRRTARKSLRDFSRKRWKRWRDSLPECAGRIPIGESRLTKAVLKHLEEVRTLDRRWRRRRTARAWHCLRVAVKRFRYSVETLLPRQDARWARKLKGLQDRLGKGHDLDVLRSRIVLLSRKRSFSPHTRVLWLRRIAEIRQQEQERYLKDVSLSKNGQKSPLLKNADHRPKMIWDLWEAELRRQAKISLASAEELEKSAATQA